MSIKHKNREGTIWRLMQSHNLYYSHESVVGQMDEAFIILNKSVYSSYEDNIWWHVYLIESKKVGEISERSLLIVGREL
jgi:hypothetical protein